MQPQEALNKRIEDLPFTDGLKRTLENHQIFTLGELLDLPVYDWHKKIKGFTFHFQHEIVSWLGRNDLDDLLKED